MILAAFHAPRDTCPFTGHMEMLALQRASCDRYGVHHIVITDSAEWVDDKFDTFETPLPRSLQRALLAGRRDFMYHAAVEFPEHHLILCDSDMVLNKDPTPIFDWSFDFGVTVHSFADSIVNTSGAFVSAGCADLAGRVWNIALARVKGDHWGDDQAAIRDTVEATLVPGVRYVDGVRMAQFPCRTHNWAPDSPDEPCDAYLVHFRGPRKTWAVEWCRRFAQYASPRIRRL